MEALLLEQNPKSPKNAEIRAQEISESIAKFKSQTIRELETQDREVITIIKIAHR